MVAGDSQFDAAEVARRIAKALGERNQDYAIGGAIALGYWAEPRGTIDVDLTLYLPPEKPSECVWLLQKIGFDVNASDAIASFNDHGFCRAAFDELRVDIFLPTIAFYEVARQRRRSVTLGEQQIMIWDAETLAVFKFMFFRRKDIADVERILRVQGDQLDKGWVRDRIIELYGHRDPRAAQWDQLVEETGG